MPKNNEISITSVKAREILNARGFPTLETTVTLSSGLRGRAEVPIGLTVNKFAAKDLYDGDHRRYKGKGMLLAANHINELIAPRLIGMSPTAQREIDLLLIELDASPDRRQLGANTMISVSLAVAKAGAISENKELFQYLHDYYQLTGPIKIPTPLFNMFSGGHHGDTNLDFKEFLLIPQYDSPTFKSTSCEAKTMRMVRAGAEVYHSLGKILRENSYDSDIGLEGGYAPNMDSSLKALDMILAAIIKAGYTAGKDFKLGLDIGSDQLYDIEAKQYIFPLDNSYFSSENLVGLYSDWLEKYPITYLEDGLANEDWSAWRQATASLGDKLVLAGDELFASSLELLRKGIAEQVANAFVLKPNQIGTLTETIECAKLAERQHYQVIVSHRGGETNDDFIVDLAVAIGARYLKAGSLARGERVAKYNRLMAIAAFVNETTPPNS
ncbi:MAG: phosphopyruvate hydratase [Patescibacteria group bacterium]|nr:phosphopyruvate hydratase [Patescibacteria group bacterium]